MHIITKLFIFLIPALLMLFSSYANDSHAQNTSGNEEIRTSEDALRATRTLNQTAPGPRRPEMPKTPQVPSMPETPKGYRNNADLFGPQSPVSPQGPIR